MNILKWNYPLGQLPLAAFAGEPRTVLYAETVLNPNRQVQQPIGSPYVAAGGELQAPLQAAEGQRRLRKLQRELPAELKGAGLNADQVLAIEKLIELEVIRRVAPYLQQVFGRLTPPVVDPTAAQGPAHRSGSRPFELLSANEFGHRLGLSDESVRLRERSGEVFSVIEPGRKRGRRYPEFQLWPGLAGEPLKRILGRLPGIDGASLYQFFTSPAMELAGLSPLQVLTTIDTEAAGAEAAELLREPVERRLAAVESAAESFSAVLAA